MQIRAVTAERLYLVVGDEADPDLEELLLETPWAEQEGKETAARVVSLLRQMV